MAGICSFFSAAFVTQYYYTQYDNSHIANSIVALVSEYSVYIPLFGILFYCDNRFRYINPLTGKKDFKTIKTDIKKFLLPFLFLNCYSLSKVSLTYQFLQLDVLPYKASMLGSLAASTISLVLINFMIARVVKRIQNLTGPLGQDSKVSKVPYRTKIKGDAVDDHGG